MAAPPSGRSLSAPKSGALRPVGNLSVGSRKGRLGSVKHHPRQENLAPATTLGDGPASVESGQRPLEEFTVRPPSSSARPARDRKSTRLNSSHLGISYAVFCLK